MVALLARMGQREWAIVAMVAAVLLGLMWYFLITQPLQGRIPEIQAEVDRLTTERDRGRAAQRALPQLRETIARLDAERQQFLRELPPTEQLGRVLSSLAQTARESGVVLRTLSRGAGDNQGVANVRATNLAMQVESPFPELYVFLRNLEGFQRFATVSGLNLTLGGSATATVGQATNPTINTSLTMTVYTYTGQAQPAQGGQPPQPGQPGQPGGQP
ncbi:type 4a pilus biogenesis protein PilO [Meiothermus sp.]|uniref:type 4a pilus biogenesis protein PilO n=1 Tax=Meiothermus sp. TaxID=1955249 RepID=UPI0021DC06CF|nr:type 4a pilus biogenesis protein PilO [Meiothermus sp.]GIW33131.1 MAG: competence protein [Meiothermus sp.]